VRAVINYQADAIVTNQQHANLGTVKGLRAWRNTVVAASKSTEAKGLPLGSLGGQLAESDPEARALIAAGFDRWSSTLSDGLQAFMPTANCHRISIQTISLSLSSPRCKGTTPRSGAESTRPFEITVDTILALVAPKINV